MKIQINSCPLCGKDLKYKKIFGMDFLDCPELITLNSISGPKQQSHYECEMSPISKLERIYILPYNIDNFEKDNKSRIYKLVTSRNGVDNWYFVTETPLIKPDTCDKLLERIQKLLLFL